MTKSTDDTTVERTREAGEGAFCLQVSAVGMFRAHPLPDRGEVTIGRGSSCAIRVDHPSVSRQHAVLHVGERLEIEDLGSANGTHVQERQLAPRVRTAVAVGELIELGDVMIVVRRNSAPARPRRLWPHGYFEARVDEQCARAERSGESFAVLRLGVATPPASGAIEEAFSLSLRALDVLGLYAPDEYEVLLVDTSADEASAVAQRLVAHIGQRGGRVNVGQAVYPRDGATPEALIAHACDAVRGDGAPELDGAGIQPAAGPAMRSLYRIVEQVAASDLGVLILGETGVGKEVLAERVHRRSPRHKHPFVKLHCASFSESLLESELFGHEKGAFTGAVQAKPGLLETAQGGTLLLDEIGELPLTMQVKLLRVLEERKVLRIGALVPRSIDVRFVAATNRDLEAEVARGRFRLDLYYRLNGMTLMIPPLRERPEEIEPLTLTLIRQACARLKRRELPRLAPEAVARLLAYSWPGNIRELRNTVERAVLLCGRDPIGVTHLPIEKMSATLPPVAARPETVGRDEPAAPHEADFDANAATVRFDKTSAAGEEAESGGGLHERVDALERRQILEALEQCAGNQTRAAKLLGISRGKLVARLDAYGIARPRK